MYKKKNIQPWEWTMIMTTLTWTFVEISTEKKNWEKSHRQVLERLLLQKNNQTNKQKQKNNNKQCILQ